MLHPRFILALSLPLAVGCERLKDVDALASPIVAQGVFVGLDLPDGVDLGEESDLLAYSAACSVFLAYVADPSELDDSPVEGATIGFKSDQNGDFALAEQGAGKYLVSAETGLVYEPGDEAVLTSEIDGESARLAVNTPDAPDVDVPTTLVPEEGFTVDLTGQGYDNVLIAVYDVTRSKLTYSNLPNDILSTYNFTHGDIDETVDIPGDAFLRQSSYVVGIAGMESADATSFEGVSQTLSAFMAGQFALRFVIVANED